MGDNLLHRARPVNGVPDLGSHLVEAQDLALLEIEENRLLFDEAPGDLLVLGEPGVYLKHGSLSRENFSQSLPERSRMANSVRHPHTRRAFRYCSQALYSFRFLRYSPPSFRW